MSDSNEPKLGFDGLIGQAEADGFDWEEEASEADEEGEKVSVLRFSLGESLYAVPAEYVREITSEFNVTPVPGAPKHVRGVGVLRRQVIGVLNLSQWLDPVAQSEEAEEGGRVLIVEAGPYTVGIEATEISGLADWPDKVLDRSRIPNSINTRTRRYAAGIRLDEDEATVLLDVPRLLDDAAVQ